MFDLPEFDDHEEVVLVSDAATGLRAVLAVHSTALGPALGGIRYWQYANATEGVADALRLSRGMTFKNALADLPIGGGKSVILANAAPKSAAQLAAFGRALNGLAGRYIAAEDVGISVADVDVIRAVTPHVVGASTGNAAAGDPSPFTARGVFVALRAAVQLVGGDLSQVRVGVLGLGAVGMRLADELHAAGAALVVADIHDARTAEAASRFGAEVVAPEALPFEPIDIYAPCALGGALDATYVERGNAAIICGAANNQLAQPGIDAALWQAGRIYVPDYLANAGGVINVAAEALGAYDRAAIDARVDKIAVAARAVIEEAQRSDTPTGEVADRLALAKIAQAKAKAAA